MERACKNCDYWSEHETCRRNAPVGEPSPSYTDADYWCGECAPKGTWNKMQRLVEAMEREALDLACLSDEIEV